MVAGAGLMAAQVAAYDVGVAVSGLPRRDKALVMAGALAVMAREEADPALFLALVLATARERVAAG
jgi:hypothetical protein